MMKVFNETKLPDDLVNRVLQSAWDATKALGHWEATSSGRNKTACKNHDNAIQEIRVREYKRQVTFGLTSEQWTVIKELAAACETVGDPKKPRNGHSIPWDDADKCDWYVTRQIKRYCGVVIRESHKRNKAS